MICTWLVCWTRTVHLAWQDDIYIPGIFCINLLWWGKSLYLYTYSYSSCLVLSDDWDVGVMSWFVRELEPTRHRWHGHPTGLTTPYTYNSSGVTRWYVSIDTKDSIRCLFQLTFHDLFCDITVIDGIVTPLFVESIKFAFNIERIQIQIMDDGNVTERIGSYN